MSGMLVGIAYRDLFVGVRRKAKYGDQYLLVGKEVGQTTTQIPMMIQSSTSIKSSELDLLALLSVIVTRRFGNTAGL